MNNRSNISGCEDTENENTSWYWWLGGMVAVITVLGNMLVILLILTRSSLRTTQNWFILSLAIADCLVGTVLFPSNFIIDILHGNCPYSNLVIDLAVNFVLYASKTNLCALTLDRYLYIVHPLKHVYMKKKSNIVKTLVASWLVAFAFPFAFFLLNIFVANKEITSFYIIFAVLSFDCLISTSLTIAYFRILYFIRRQQAQIKKQANQLQHNYPERRETERCKKNNTMIRVLGGVIGFFVISYLFVDYRMWLKYVSTPPTTDPTWDTITYYLLRINSAINIFFYGIFKKDFRAEIIKLFGKSVSCK